MRKQCSDLGGHENQSTINDTNNTNISNTNDILRPWESTPQEKELLDGQWLTVEGRKQRPEQGQRRGLLSSRHDTRDLPSTTIPLEETSGPVRRPVAALGWCGAAAANETPASPAATAGRVASGDPELREVAGGSPTPPHRPAGGPGSRPAPAPAGSRVAGGRRGRCGSRGRGAGHSREAFKKIVSFRSGGGRHFSGAARAPAAPSGVRRSAAAEEGGGRCAGPGRRRRSGGRGREGPAAAGTRCQRSGGAAARAPPPSRPQKFDSGAAQPPGPPRRGRDPRGETPRLRPPRDGGRLQRDAGGGSAAPGAAPPATWQRDPGDPG